MRIPITTLGLVLLYCSSCHSVDTDPGPGQVEASLQAILEEAIRGSYDQIAGASMTVIAPELDLHWTGTTGFDSKERQDSLRSQQPFRIASITKTFVAAAMLRLHEDDYLSLDEPISEKLPVEYVNMLEQGGYDPQAISWRQCLNHTSGLYDYAMGGDTYVEMCMNNPKKRWTRTEQVQLAIDTGKPVGEPGEQYKYADTGYVLAGAVIEMAQDTNLGAALRELLAYQDLGLTSTWLESIEPATSSEELVHSYFRHIDASEWDPSIDLYGGGGLVSTTQDLAAFFHQLFNHQVYQKPETLALMLKAPAYAESYQPDEDPRYKDYRQGLWKVKLFGEEAYMHGGLWSTVIVHVPSLNCTLAAKYTNGWWERQVKQVVLTIKNAQENS